MTRTEHRKKLAADLQKAGEGRCKWLDKLIREAGYMPTADRVKVRQKELQQMIGVQRKVLLEWEEAGLPLERGPEGHIGVYHGACVGGEEGFADDALASGEGRDGHGTNGMRFRAGNLDASLKAR